MADLKQEQILAVSICLIYISSWSLASICNSRSNAIYYTTELAISYLNPYSDCEMWDAKEITVYHMYNVTLFVFELFYC